MNVRDLDPRLGGCGCQYDAAGRLFLPRCVCPDRFQSGDGTMVFPNITVREEPR